MGLGLTISRMIIHKLNGELNVRSNQNQGTTFFFEILVEANIPQSQ